MSDRHVSPYITVVDAGAALDFYARAFGAVETGPRPCPGMAGAGATRDPERREVGTGRGSPSPRPFAPRGKHAPFSATPTGPALRSGDRVPKAKWGRPASWKAPRQGRWSETASTVQRRIWRQLARTTKDNVHHAICSNVSGFWATFFAKGEGVERDHVRNLCVAKCDGLAGWLSEQYRAFGGKCYAVYADGKFVNEAAQKAPTNQRSEHGVLESTTSWERGLPARAERPPNACAGKMPALPGGRRTRGGRAPELSLVRNQVPTNGAWYLCTEVLID